MYTTRLSVNINKVALLRNARGNNLPNLLQVAQDCERFGAEGITVHPRPDERHITYNDVYELRDIVTTPFNIEGYPDSRFLDMVCRVKPQQCTLVPDAPTALTSDAGWDTLAHQAKLSEIIAQLKEAGVSVSLFVDPLPHMIEGAAHVGATAVELYTGPYAKQYPNNRAQAIAPYIAAAHVAISAGLQLNAGHDLNLDNLHYLKHEIPQLDEVSIGHALISDTLYYGLQNTIQLYKKQLLSKVMTT